MASEAILTEKLLGAALTETADMLARHNVRYAVIGGMAAGFRSQPRFTKDVDFLLRPTQLQLPAVLNSLKEKGLEFNLESTLREWTRHHMISLSYHGVPVDWLKPVLPIFQHVLENATVESWLGHSVWVASPEGLILLKLIAFRTQDLLDIENIVAYHRQNLDLDWIRNEWKLIAGPEDPRIIRLMQLAQRQDSPPESPRTDH